jgi:hypothetical protein
MPAIKKLAGMARNYTGKIIVVFKANWNYYAARQQTLAKDSDRHKGDLRLAPKQPFGFRHNNINSKSTAISHVSAAPQTAQPVPAC